jgi:polysaccharide biosynthesis transport protein
MDNGGLSFSMNTPTPIDNPNLLAGSDGDSDFSEKILSQVFVAKILLQRFWWIFLITISLGLAVQSYRVLSKNPIYVSSAQMIVSGRLALPEGGAVYSEELANFFGTQMALMQSSQVHKRVISRVQALRPDLKPSSVNIIVHQSPNASIFILNAYGSDPDYTQAYLDATMQEYINFKREMRVDTADRTFIAINEEVLNLQQKIKEAEDEKVEFQKKNNIVFIQEQGNTVGNYLARLNQELSDYQMQVCAIDTLYLAHLQSVEDTAGGVSFEKLGVSKDYFDAKKRYNQLKAEYEDGLTYMNSNHPKIADLRREIDYQNNILQIYKRQCEVHLLEKKQALQAQIKTLQGMISNQEVHALDYSRRLGEFERINSRLDRQRKVLDQLLTSIQSIHLNLNLEQESVAVLENASSASEMRENVANQVVGGAFFGLLIGACIIGAIGALDRRIVSVEDISKRFDEPIMGMVPYQKDVNKTGIDLLRSNDNRIVLAEACRSIRSSLIYAMSSKSRFTGGVRVFLVTSSVPAEGKSTISANLAITLAFTAAKTIIIDSDLRRGHLHKKFKMDRSPGWSEVLQKTVSLDEAIRKTDIEHLDFMPCGEYSERPGELLMSAEADRMVEELKRRYDYVVFDTAPVLATDDTLVFAQKVDGVLFVMRSGQTRIKEAQLAFQNLFFRHIKVSGIVLNGVDAHGPGAYYYRYQDYYTKSVNSGSTRSPFSDVVLPGTSPLTPRRGNTPPPISLAK